MIQGPPGGSVPCDTSRSRVAALAGVPDLMLARNVRYETRQASSPGPQLGEAYHGVLAPGAAWRDELVPKVARSSSGHKDAAPLEREPGVSPRPPHRYLWAELMRRVFGLDVLRCRVCRTHRRLVALITERTVIVAILAHLGLETDPPAIQPARAPPR